MVPGGIAVFVVLGVFAHTLFRSYESLARRSLARRYVGLQVHEARLRGM